MLNHDLLCKKLNIHGVTDVERHADGGEATIFKGLYEREAVAIRVYKNPEKLEQIQNELRAARAVRGSQYFLRLIKEPQDREVAFTIWEWSDKTLQDMINETPGGCDKETAIRLLRNVARGLDALHTRRYGEEFLHADIHPGNLFLKEDDFVKIGDFGAVYSLDSATIRSHRVHFQGFCLAEYMANPAKARDVFAFVVTYLTLRFGYNPTPSPKIPLKRSEFNQWLHASETEAKLRKRLDDNELDAVKSNLLVPETGIDRWLDQIESSTRSIPSMININGESVGDGDASPEIHAQMCFNVALRIVRSIDASVEQMPDGQSQLPVDEERNTKLEKALQWINEAIDTVADQADFYSIKVEICRYLLRDIAQDFLDERNRRDDLIWRSYEVRSNLLIGSPGELHRAGMDALSRLHGKRVSSLVGEARHSIDRAIELSNDAELYRQRAELRLLGLSLADVGPHDILHVELLHHIPLSSLLGQRLCGTFDEVPSVRHSRIREIIDDLSVALNAFPYDVSLRFLRSLLASIESYRMDYAPSVQLGQTERTDTKDRHRFEDMATADRDEICDQLGTPEQLAMFAMAEFADGHCDDAVKSLALAAQNWSFGRENRLRRRAMLLYSYLLEAEPYPKREDVLLEYPEKMRLIPWDEVGWIEKFYVPKNDGKMQFPVSATIAVNGQRLAINGDFLCHKDVPDDQLNVVGHPIPVNDCAGAFLFRVRRNKAAFSPGEVMIATIWQSFESNGLACLENGNKLGWVCSLDSDYPVGTRAKFRVVAVDPVTMRVCLRPIDHEHDERQLWQKELQGLQLLWETRAIAGLKMHDSRIVDVVPSEPLDSGVMEVLCKGGTLENPPDSQDKWSLEHNLICRAPLPSKWDNITANNLIGRQLSGTLTAIDEKRKQLVLTESVLKPQDLCASSPPKKIIFSDGWKRNDWESVVATIFSVPKVFCGKLLRDRQSEKTEGEQRWCVKTSFSLEDGRQLILPVEGILCDDLKPEKLEQRVATFRASYVPYTDEGRRFAEEQDDYFREELFALFGVGDETMPRCLRLELLAAEDDTIERLERMT